MAFSVGRNYVVIVLICAAPTLEGCLKVIRTMKYLIRHRCEGLLVLLGLGIWKGLRLSTGLVS